MDRQRPGGALPAAASGMRIGLFGGSFNPAHDGHRLASLTALRRLRLDRVWWIVTPGNPLKDNATLPPLAERLATTQAFAHHPRIDVTGFEATIGTRYTFDTIAYLKRRFPRVKFVWIMGADNLVGFHRWQHWRDIVRLVPIAIVDRPGSTLRGMQTRAAKVMGAHRVAEADAATLADRQGGAFLFLHGPRSPLSSTALRLKAEPRWKNDPISRDAGSSR